MTTYCSIQRNKDFSVPSSKWLTVSSYDKINKDTHRAYNGKSEIVIPESGVYLFSAKITWASSSRGQRLVRFISDLGTINDDTGTMDSSATAGKDYVIHNWPSYMKKGRTMSLQIQQTSGSNLKVLMVQFKATKISG